MASSFNSDPIPVLSSSGDGQQQQQQKPGENDVILGIGCNKHCGNVKFRQFIKAYKRARFQTNPKIAAAEAVKEVVAFWRNLSPRGRFLAQSKTNGEWHEVEEKQAMRIASFFLLDQQAKGDLKRAKSGEAKKQLLMQQQQAASTSSGMLGASNLEPVPIGPRSSSSNNNNRSTSVGWQQQLQKQQAPQQVQSFASLPSKPAQQSQSQTQTHSLQDLWGDDDLNPLPLKFNEVDFDPFPITPKGGRSSSTSAGYSSSSQDMYNPTKPQQKQDMMYPSKQQQQLYGNGNSNSTPGELQVSVNMVVNTMLHQGNRNNMGDNANGRAMGGGVNTVTNIQIGTINDPSGMQQQQRRQQNQYPTPNNVDYSRSTCNNYSSSNNFSNTKCAGGSSMDPASSFGPNFQVSANANPNNFIQVSTQSNGPNDYSSSGMNNNNNQNNMLYGMQQQQQLNGNDCYSSSSVGQQQNNSSYHMNDFQSAFFGGGGGSSNAQDNFNNNANNSYAAACGGDMNNGNANYMAMNNNSGGMMMPNNAMSMNMNGNPNSAMAMPSNAMSMNGNNNMRGGTMNMNALQGGNGMNMMNNNNNGNGGQGWNKNNVANSVPCAADLLGSVFDDF